MTKAKVQGTKKEQDDLAKLTAKVLELMEMNENLRMENEVYRKKSPIVGIRWWGMGGYQVRMKNPTKGQSMLSLDGYGDRGFLDQETWNTVSKNELGRKGLVVRDDAVLEELGMTGYITAPKDKFSNPNALTLQETKDLLMGPISKLKAKIEKMGSHQAIEHLRQQYKLLDINDVAKSLLLKSRQIYLAVYYNWSRAHDFDIELACKVRDIIGYEGMSREELVEKLTLSDISKEE